MQLPISIYKGDKFYNEISVIEPTPKILSEVQIKGSKNDIPGSFIALLTGCIKSITSIEGKEITDPLAIKSLVRSMPYRSAEYVATKLMLMIDENDYIEGIYECPRCKERIITECEKDNEGNIVTDTRDKVSDIEVRLADETEVTFTIELEKPVEILEKQTGKVIASAETIEFYHPTLDHYTKASLRAGNSNPMNLQYAIYAFAMKMVDMEPVDEKTKSTMGIKVIENLGSIRDLRKINNEIIKYGYNTTINKICQNCGKIFDAEVDTSNFFASSLRLK